MTFTRWLHRQADRDDPVGDLACDAMADPGWPSRGKKLETFEIYLELHGVEPDVVRQAWAEWKGAADGA